MPLIGRGLQIVGADLSLPMMREFQKKIVKSDSHSSFVQTDAATLPFRDESFDVVYAVHVYHLIPRWQTALQDARRVLKRGGRFLVSFHYRAGDSPTRKIRLKLAELARKRGFDISRPGAKSDQEMRRELEKSDGDMRGVKVARCKEESIPTQVLENVRASIFSDSWLRPA
jgi:SAM-dependent methyltransferase